MSLFEIIVVGTSLVCCTGGVAWLLYDINKQIKGFRLTMKQAEEESTLGLVEDDEE
jgi:hypothetical protein